MTSVAKAKLDVKLLDGNPTTAPEGETPLWYLSFMLTSEPDRDWRRIFDQIAQEVIGDLKRSSDSEILDNPELKYARTEWEVGFNDNGPGSIFGYCSPDEIENLCKAVRTIVDRTNTEYEKHLDKSGTEQAHILSVKNRIEELKKTFNFPV